MNDIQLNDMATGQFFDGVLLYKQVLLKTGRNGNAFLQLKVSDNSAELDAKKWEANQELVDALGKEGFAQVRGKADEFNGKAQFIINTIEPVDGARIDPLDFLPKAPIDPDVAMDEVRDHIERMTNPYLKTLCHLLLDDPKVHNGFMLAPAAVSLHNAYLHGLLEHTLKIMTEVDNYAALNPTLNRDLVVAGALWHDIGKIDELTYETGFTYSDVGSLVGHLNLGVVLLRDKISQIEDFPEDLANLMSHMILSHHGALEYGSPVLPAFPEAMVLHGIDNLNAKLDMMVNAINDDTTDEAWTAKHWALGTRIISAQGTDMEIIIDGDSGKLSCDDGDVLADIVGEINEFVKSSGKKISNLTLDGNEISVDAPPAGSVDDFQTLSVKSEMTEQMPAMMLDEIKASLSNLKATMMQTANKVQEGNISEAMELFEVVIEGWNTLHDALVMLASFKEFSLDELMVGDKSVSAILTEPSSFLKEMGEALKSKDYITVADILEFEILPLLDQFDQALEAIRPKL